MLVPLFQIVSRLGWINTYLPLIVPGLANAFGIFFMRQYAHSVPDTLLDAARIDGSSEWGIYWRVVLPQIGPALATLGILTFMGSWNSYLWPLIVITTHERRTLPIVLTWYNSMHGTRADLTMAAGVMVVIPILIVYVFIQRWIVQGISMTGFK